MSVTFNIHQNHAGRNMSATLASAETNILTFSKHMSPEFLFIFLVLFDTKQLFNN